MTGSLHPTAIAAGAVSGPGHVLLGYRLLLRPGVRRYVALPLLANILLYSLAFWAAFAGLDTALDRWLPAALEWLRWLLFPLVGLLLLVLGFFSFTLLANLLLAPFNGLLSARVEQVLSGAAPAGSGLGMAAEMARSLRQEVRRLGYILVRVLAVFALGLVPVVGVVAAPLGLLLGAWLLAMEFAGNPMGNWGWDLERQRAFLRQHRWTFLAFGFAAMGLALVPVVNFALVPAAVSGATALCLRLRGDNPPAAPAPAPPLPDGG
jgi:CysZ protein